MVVADTTKVRIFKQITTSFVDSLADCWLLLIPQRYEFSSKSQQDSVQIIILFCCCWYHKGTNFQANHNDSSEIQQNIRVVADTTKVRIFKQITTKTKWVTWPAKLLLIPQRYEFSSKSQLLLVMGMSLVCCCWYHKGTNFQANHNLGVAGGIGGAVVADTTKVRIFKQITTTGYYWCNVSSLLLIPQRYEFSSKSQQEKTYPSLIKRCCWYHKGTNFQANHNQYNVA